MIRRYLSFIAVGALATAVHFCGTVALVTFVGWRPLIANCAAYCAALIVSFIGQSRLTFVAQAAGTREFAKFTATSLTGFALNTLAYAALLRWTSLDYRLALLIVLFAVAALTYMLMSRWVFLHVRRLA